MKKKKIAHIITRLTLGGAQENTVFSFLNHDKDKYEVYLVTGSDTSFGGKGYLEKLNVENNVVYIKDMVNPIRIIKDFKSFIAIYTFIRKNNIDIVHTHSSKAGVLGRIAAKLAGVPVIVHTIHGWSFHDHMNKIKKRGYVLVERLADKCCDKLITVTNLDIEKGLNEKIGKRHKYITVRSGIDFDKFQDFDTDKVNDLVNHFKGKQIIGTVGRLSEQKNPLDFVRIAKELIDNHNNLHFIMIGDGPLRKQVENYIEQNKLSKHISLPGLRTDINHIVRIFDVFLLTSLWEGLPRVIPEAMCCKVPVVANRVDGVGEIIKDGINGFCTEPHDIREACDKIKSLLDDINLRGKIINNALQTIYPEYEAYYMVRQIEKQYEIIFNQKQMADTVI